MTITNAQGTEAPAENLDAEAGADTEGAAKEKPETDDDILSEARDRYRSCDSFDSDNLDAARGDLLFLSGGANQWDQIDAQIRTAQRRPMITVNNLPTFLHQVVNDLRQNKLGGQVHPVEKNDEETAEVVQGLIRHIEYDSNASVATTTAVNSAAGIGFGWFRLATEFEKPDSFDQKIMFKRIRNALSVHIDPLSQELDGSDMKFAFVDSLESRVEFKKMYPDANANNTNLIGQDLYKGWFTEDTVLVCEYYRIKTTKATLCELQDGTKGWKDELPSELHGHIKRERVSYKQAVEWFKLTGADVLERTEIKCEWIPVFPVYGDEIDIDGKVIRFGIIRNSKDSFKMYNVCITTAIEEVASRAKSPYIMAEGQDEGHEEQWGNINRIPYPAVKYKPTTVDGLLVPAPQRQQMADIPAGWLQMTMHFADNKKATTGLFDSSLGARGSATSGIQEREQQQQGDVANFHYADNLKITYRHALRCIVNMLPHYYDAPRAVRILGEDETSSVVKINQPIERKNAKTGAIEQVMHDLTVADFDITLSSGPAYSTQRQEAAEFMADAMQAAKDPAAANVLTYLAIKNRDVPGAEEATKMLKKLLPQGVADDEGEEEMIQTPKGPIPASQAGAAIAGMDQALNSAEQALNDVKTQDVKNKARELEIKDKEADTKQFEAQTKRIEADAKMVEAEAQAAAAGDSVQAAAVAAAREAVHLMMNTPLDQIPQEAIDMAHPGDGGQPAAPAAAPAAPAEPAPAPAPAEPPKASVRPKGMVIKAPSGQHYEVGFTE